MPPRASAKPQRRDRSAGRGDVAFFLALILFLVFSLGSVIVGQKVALRYMLREFPRVAEHNYRALQGQVAQLEDRLLGELGSVQYACVAAQPPAVSDVQREPSPEEIFPDGAALPQ